MKNKVLEQKLLAWAEERVGKEPTYKVERWDTEFQRHVVDSKPNTVERELAGILGNHCDRNFDDYDGSELREVLSDFCMNGTKGYLQMTRDELLAEIEAEMTDFYRDDLLELIGKPEATDEELAQHFMECVTKESE